jgi:pterin-4a-carbinolamine dehydratase
MPASAVKQTALHLTAIPHCSKPTQTVSRMFQVETFLYCTAFAYRRVRKVQIINHHPDNAIRFYKVILHP